MKCNGLISIFFIILCGMLIVAGVTYPVLAQVKQPLNSFDSPSSSSIGTQSALSASDEPIPHPILSDVRIRRAIAYCTDKDALIVSIYPTLTLEQRQELIMDTFIPKTNWAYTAPTTTYPYSPTLGRDLLVDAGWTLATGADYRTKDGKELVLTLTTTDSSARMTFLAVFEAQMKDCGIHIIRNHQTGTWLFGNTTGLRVRDFELGEFAWVNQDDPGGNTFYACDQIPLPTNDWSGQNYMGWCNQTASNAIAQASNTQLPQDQRKAYYATVINHLAEDVPSLPLFMRQDNIAWEHIDFNLETFEQEMEVTSSETSSVDLIFTDYSGNQQTVTVPSGAVTQTITLRYYPLVANADPPPDNMQAAKSFRLGASINGVAQDTFTFAKPITVTVSYTTTDIVDILDENSLELFFWDGITSSWKDASQTCPVPERYKWLDTTLNLYVVRICHLTEFGLIGTKNNRTYLPALIR